MVRSLSPLVLAGLIALANPGHAQAQSDVIFKVPLNLTKLAADITKVTVTCLVAPPSGQEVGRGEQIFPVFDGQVVTTAMIIVTVADTARWRQAENVGNPMGYACALTGFSNRLQRWDQFSETQATEVFRLTPTPSPIQGMFVW